MKTTKEGYLHCSTSTGEAINEATPMVTDDNGNWHFGDAAYAVADWFWDQEETEQSTERPDSAADRCDAWEAAVLASLNAGMTTGASHGISWTLQLIDEDGINLS